MTDQKDVGDALRLEFVIETVDRMAAHLAAFAAFAATGDLVAARGFWDCVKLCGRAISETINEIEGERE